MKVVVAGVSTKIMRMLVQHVWRIQRSSERNKFHAKPMYVSLKNINRPTAIVYRKTPSTEDCHHAVWLRTVSKSLRNRCTPLHDVVHRIQHAIGKPKTSTKVRQSLRKTSCHQQRRQHPWQTHRRIKSKKLIWLSIIMALRVAAIAAQPTHIKLIVRSFRSRASESLFANQDRESSRKMHKTRVHKRASEAYQLVMRTAFVLVIEGPWMAAVLVLSLNWMVTLAAEQVLKNEMTSVWIVYGVTISSTSFVKVWKRVGFVFNRMGEFWPP